MHCRSTQRLLSHLVHCPTLAVGKLLSVPLFKLLPVEPFLFLSHKNSSRSRSGSFWRANEQTLIKLIVEGQVWSRSQVRYGLVPSLYCGLVPSLYCGLVPRPGMALFPGQIWPRSQVRCGLVHSPSTCMALFPSKVWPCC